MVEHEREGKNIRGITPKFCTIKGRVNLVISLARPMDTLNSIQVKIGNNSALDLIIQDPHTLLCIVPPGIPGTVDVVILEDKKVVAIEKNAFSYRSL